MSFNRFRNNTLSSILLRYFKVKTQARCDLAFLKKKVIRDCFLFVYARLSMNVFSDSPSHNDLLHTQELFTNMQFYSGAEGAITQK